MHKNRFSKLLVALAASGMMTYAFATPASEAPQTNPATSNAAVDFGAETKQLLEQWIEDLKKAFPVGSQSFSLIDFQNQGDQSTATIRSEAVNTMDPYGNPLIISTDTKIKINHGFTFSEFGSGVAKIEWTTALGENTEPEILEALGSQPFSQGEGIITLKGDIHTSIKSPKAFKQEIDRTTLISIPSYEGRFDSYNARATSDLSFLIPSIEISDSSPYSGDFNFTIKNLKLTMKDRPIKTGYWEFVGTSSGSIEQMEFKNDGKPIVTFNQIQFSEKGSIDDKKLYSDTFSFSSQGSFKHQYTDQTIKLDSLKIEGSIQKLAIEPYLDLIKALQDSSFYNEDKMQSIGTRLIAAEPEFNFDKISLTIDGHEGHASLKMSVGATTSDEQKMPIVMLLAQKFKVDANIDIPDAWLSVFLHSDDIEDAQEALKQGEQEGYLSHKDGRIKSSFKYEMGNMTVNGKPLKGMGGFPF